MSWALVLLGAASHALPRPSLSADAIETTVALLGGLGLRAFVLDSRYVPSASMEPTFEVGDLLILEKVSFRSHPPVAGEVVCFRAPPALERGTPRGACYIKRIVALAGDEVRVQGGKLQVNGSPVSEPYVKDLIRYRLRSTRVLSRGGTASSRARTPTAPRTSASTRATRPHPTRRGRS